MRKENGINVRVRYRSNLESWLIDYWFVGLGRVKACFELLEPSLLNVNKYCYGNTNDCAKQDYS